MAEPDRYFDARRRAEVIDEVDQGTFDLVVIGGGINGAGVAHDSALRGLKVLLLEQRDLAFGTSSRSSKLIHGGLRYLEHYQFRLVFEGTNERAALRAVAPHLVRPLMFALPVYEGARFPLWMMDVGLWMYDSLSLFKVEKRHITLRSPKRMLEREPLLNPKGLTGGIIYYDCMTDDARMTLENAIAAGRNGAPVITQAQVVALDKTGEDDELAEVTFRRSARRSPGHRPHQGHRQLHGRLDRQHPPDGGDRGHGHPPHEGRPPGAPQRAPPHPSRQRPGRAAGRARLLRDPVERPHGHRHHRHRLHG